MKSVYRISALKILILVPNVQAPSQPSCRYTKSLNGLSEYDNGGPYTLDHFDSQRDELICASSCGRIGASIKEELLRRESELLTVARSRRCTSFNRTRKDSGSSTSRWYVRAFRIGTRTFARRPNRDNHQDQQGKEFDQASLGNRGERNWDGPRTCWSNAESYYCQKRQAAGAMFFRGADGDGF